MRIMNAANPVSYPGSHGSTFSKCIRLLLVGAMMLSTTYCATTEVVTTNSKPALSLAEPVPDALRLDVMILPFDPNLKALEQSQDDIPVSEEVRKAESRYLAYHLKETLEQTGNWGVVRVIPTPSSYQPLIVQGTILASDGENLAFASKRAMRLAAFGCARTIPTPPANTRISQCAKTPFRTCTIKLLMISSKRISLETHRPLPTSNAWHN